MRIDCDMADEKKLYVAAWSTRNPQAAIESLRYQLEAAIIIWPELKDFKIVNGTLRAEVERLRRTAGEG